LATTRRADMFTADGKPSDDDPRENRPRSGDEGTTLVEALRCQRLTLEVNAQVLMRGRWRGVSPSRRRCCWGWCGTWPRWSVTFRMMMAGQDVPRQFCSDTDREGDFDGAFPTPKSLRRRGTHGVRRWTPRRGSWPRRQVSTSPATIL
jgi:hypothetical protein